MKKRHALKQYWMSLKKNKLESMLLLYKIANKNCATLAKKSSISVTILYRNMYSKRANGIQSRHRPVLRLRSDCPVHLFTLKGSPPTKLSRQPTTTNYLIHSAVLLEKVIVRQSSLCIKSGWLLLTETCLTTNFAAYQDSWNALSVEKRVFKDDQF